MVVLFFKFVYVIKPLVVRKEINVQVVPCVHFSLVTSSRECHVKSRDAVAIEGAFPGMAREIRTILRFV